MQQGLPAIVLEYLPGGSLHKLLHEPRADAGPGNADGSPTPLAPELLSRLSLEVAQGVAYLHQSQVSHRQPQPQPQAQAQPQPNPNPNPTRTLTLAR